MTTDATPSSARPDGRTPDQLRPIRFQNGIAPYATGSTLIEWGNTRVICGVTVEEIGAALDEGTKRHGRLDYGGVFHAPLLHADAQSRATFPREKSTGARRKSSG